MPFLVAVGIGLAAGLARGGKLSGLARMRFRSPMFLAAGTLLWLAVAPLSLQRWPEVAAIAPYLQTMAHVALLLFVWQNRRVDWLLLIGAGLLANAVVMAANGGQIPVDGELLSRLAGVAPSTNSWQHFAERGPGTRFAWLGDTILLGPPFPWPRILSPGDVAIMIGAILTLQSAMRRGAPDALNAPPGGRGAPTSAAGR